MKLARLIITTSVLAIITVSCSTSKTASHKDYSVQFLKSGDKYKTYLILRPVEKSPSGSTLAVPVNVYVNDLLFDNYPNGKIQDQIVMETKPESNTRLQVFTVGYKTVDIEKLKLQRGDSVIVTVRMQESNEPLYDKSRN